MTEERESNGEKSVPYTGSSALGRFENFEDEKERYTVIGQLGPDRSRSTDVKTTDNYAISNSAVELYSRSNVGEGKANLPKKGLVKKLGIAAACLGLGYVSKDYVTGKFNDGVDRYLGKNQVSYSLPDLTDAERLKLIVDYKMRDNPEYAENILNNSISYLENKTDATPEDRLQLEKLKKKRQDFLSGEIKITSLDDLTWD